MSKPIFFCTLLLTQVLSAFSQDKLFYNAKIFTANRQSPYAEAIGIRNGKIIAVGSNDEVRSSLKSDAETVDMKGGFLMPGFVDSHEHAIKGGITLTKPNIDDEDISIDELKKFAEKTVAAKEKMTGEFLVVYGLNINAWSKLEEISAAFNNTIFRSIPVFLKGSDGHTGWANDLLLGRFGITLEFVSKVPESEKQYYGMKDGRLNGFVSEAALKKVLSLLPNEINYKLAAENAINYNNRLGITAWLDPSTAYTNQVGNELLDAYQYLYKSGKLTAHVAATIVADANDDPVKQINILKKIRKEYSDSNFKIIGFKIFADGVIEFPTRTAALSVPYTGTNSSGVLMFEPKKFASFVTTADKEGLLVHVHAIGDRAVNETLNGFGKMRSTNRNRLIPHTITHLQIVQPGDFDRFKKLNVLASFQLLWAFGDVTTINIVKPYIAPSLFKWQYPSRSILQTGATICGASDWPVSSADPIVAISRAETRSGPLGVLDSSQCMPRLAMLYAYTIDAAKALMMENKIGSLEPGKSADMIFIDKDMLTISADDFAHASVLWTMFQGKVVYKK